MTFKLIAFEKNYRGKKQSTNSFLSSLSKNNYDYARVINDLGALSV